MPHPLGPDSHASAVSSAAIAGDDPDLVAAKAEVRAAAIRRRADADPALGSALAQHLLDAWSPPAGAAVAGFWPIRDEIDIRPLLHALAARGHPIGLPVTPRRGLPLSFRRWTPGAHLLPGRFGTVIADGPDMVPDVLLVPLLAFDRAGRRLGYGGGYYDRTLAGLPGAQAIGCAYALQEIATVPTGPHDIRLPAVATERGLIRCGG